MDDRESIARADANYVQSWRALTAAMDGGEVRERDGVLAVNTGIPIPWFNIAFITRPLASPAATLRHTIEYYDAHAVPFIVRIRERVDPSAEAALASMGLTYSDTVPGMVLKDIAAPSRHVEALEIRLIRDEMALADHIEVVQAAFGMSPEVAGAFLNSRLLTLPDFELFVGYQQGAPVATSALLMSHRVAGVYNVATLESQRGRGYGEAMTWHAVHRGAEAGCLLASLQASEMGKPVYERMGFRTVAPYRTFVRSESRA